MQGAFEFYRDLPRRRRRPERLIFVAIPDPWKSSEIGEFREQYVCENGLKGARIKTDRLHMSLPHVGDFGHLRTKLVYAARQAGRGVSMPPFEVTFRFITSFESAPRAGSRPDRWPLVLLCEDNEVRELYQRLATAMEKHGLEAGAVEHFIPHMTLIYGSKRMPLKAIKPIRFVVNEFALIHSELGFTRYNVLDRWPLRLTA